MYQSGYREAAVLKLTLPVESQMNRGTRAARRASVWVQKSCNFEIDLVFREPMKQEKHDVYRSVRNCSFESDFVCTVLSTSKCGTRGDLQQSVRSGSFETDIVCIETMEQERRDVY